MGLSEQGVRCWNLLPAPKGVPSYADMEESDVLWEDIMDLLYRYHYRYNSLSSIIRNRLRRVVWHRIQFVNFLTEPGAEHRPAI